MNKNIRIYYIVSAFLLVVFSVLIISKNENEIIIGNLIFQTDKINWGIVQENEKYTQFIKVYNPTDRAISLKISQIPDEFEVRKPGNFEQDWINDGFDIYPNSTDTLLFIFEIPDSTLIGNYVNEAYIEENGEVQFTHLLLEAQIIDNFSKISHDGQANPQFVTVKNSFDFGKMLARDLVCTSFPIYNKGGKNLIIRKIETSCGCTAAIADKQIITPGDSTTLDIAFHLLDNRGFQHKTITLFCNDPICPIVLFTIKGEILSEN